jgi:hypothetical protein
LTSASGLCHDLVGHSLFSLPRFPIGLGISAFQNISFERAIGVWLFDR